jgi:multicomponent Na+:H+ antiporter subunit E
MTSVTSHPTIVFTIVCFGAWLVIHGADPTDLAGLATGLMASAGAAHAARRLSPPWLGRLAPMAGCRMVGRFLWLSILAGLDVAGRVFDPRLPLRPGFVSYPICVPRGMPEAAFTTLASLVPGTLAVRTGHDGTLLVHCLDEVQPVLNQLSSDEALLARACGWPLDHA